MGSRERRTPRQSRPSRPIRLKRRGAGRGGAAAAYEPQLLRLSEILGALSYLQSICVDSTAAAAKAQEQDQLWRERMQNLMSAEAAGQRAGKSCRRL